MRFELMSLAGIEASTQDGRNHQAKVGVSR